MTNRLNFAGCFVVLFLKKKKAIKIGKFVLQSFWLIFAMKVVLLQ